MGNGESIPTLLFESARHAPWLVGFGIVVLAFLAWTTLRLKELGGWRWPALLLKFTGIALLVFCLLEPLLPSRRPVAGANIFALLVDSSQSMALPLDLEESGRPEALRESLGTTQKPDWLDRLETQFKVHRFAFGERLRRYREPGELEFADRSSSLSQALDEIRRRYEGQPLAGALVWSDGSLTGGGEGLVWPPGFPVHTLFTGGELARPDAALTGVSVRESAFEDAPVTLGADAVLLGCEEGRGAELRFLDESDRLLESRRITASGPVHKETVHVQVKPESRGITGFRVEIVLGASPAEEGAEARESVANPELTLENNRLFAVADLRTGPYQVLYVTGRPNWEYKFLRRALREDKELQLAALIRIARREPKFEWKSRDGEQTNPLFRGFGKDPEETGDYDQPVLVRQDMRDETELAGGFPTKDPDLFAYSALVLDDIESAFFTFDQLEAIERFVSRRGGGLVMLGGMESFQRGGYAGGPLEALLPVYLNPPGRALPDSGAPYELTREGLVSPWARLRMDTSAEQERLDRMPGFLVVNRLGLPKPGASLVGHFRGNDGHSYPALVSQSYGRGRSIAIGIGDVWRWGFRDPEQRPDMDRFWRQLVRWLVVDAPRRVEVETSLDDGRFPALASLRVTVHDEEFRKDSDARVRLVLTRPSGEADEVALEPAPDAPGVFHGSHICYEPGVYRAKAEAQTQDSRVIGDAEAGWALNPGAQELSRPGGDAAVLQRIASETSGSVVAEEELGQLVDSLATREAPVMETVIRPIWHLPAFLLLAIGAFVGEWGIRRWKGVP